MKLNKAETVRRMLAKWAENADLQPPAVADMDDADLIMCYGALLAIADMGGQVELHDLAEEIKRRARERVLRIMMNENLLAMEEEQ